MGDYTLLKTTWANGTGVETATFVKLEEVIDTLKKAAVDGYGRDPYFFLMALVYELREASR